MDKRILTFAVCCAGLLSFAQENRRAPWFQPVQATSGGGGGSVYNDLIVNDLANVSTAANQTSYATPSYQPALGALVLVTVINTKSSAPDIPTFSGNGLAWVQIGTSNFNTLAAPTQRITMFRGQGASPTSGPGIADFGGATQTGCIIQVVEFQGADATGANGANALIQTYLNGADATANPSVAFSTPALPGTNALFFAYGDNVDAADGRTPMTNWVNLRNLSYGTPGTGGAFNYQMNALAGTTVSNAASTRNWAGIAVEVRPGVESVLATRPVMVQHLATYTAEQSGNNFTNYLPNPTLAGNFLAVHMVYSYDSGGKTVTITDNKGSSYTLAQTVNNRNGVVVADYYLTNCASGISWINVNFSADSSFDFHICVSEFAHVASYDPIDSLANATPTGPLVAGGEITSATDGDLILCYQDDVGIGTLVPSYPIAGFLGGGGRFLSTQSLLGESAAFAVQAKAASMNYLTSFIQASSDSYQSSVIAYERGPGGTLPSPTAMRIIHLQEDDQPAETSSRNLVPFEGNLMVVACTYVKSSGNISAIAVDPMAAMTKIATTNIDDPQLFYLAGPPVRNNPPLILSLTKDSASQELFCFDVANASTSPLGGQVEASGSAPIDSSVTNAAQITPTASSGLIINLNAFDVGPPSSGSQIMDSVCYVGATDASHLNRGDAVQHYFNPDTSPISFGQQLKNDCCTTSATSWYALAVEFKGQ